MTQVFQNEEVSLNDTRLVYASSWVSDGQGTNNEARALVGKSEDGYHPTLDISKGGGSEGGFGWHNPLPSLEAAKEEAHKLLNEWLFEDQQPSIYGAIPTGSVPAIILSSLLKETHSALSEHSSVSLVDAVRHVLEREFSTQQQQSTLIEEARVFLNVPTVGSTLEIAEHLIDEARENRLRDNDPPRTVEQHVRELLANGDEPVALLEAIDKWRNPDHLPEQSESLRLVMAEEWARKLALEQQPPSTIHASLVLNVPDSNVDGHSHTAVANRIYGQIAGAPLPFVQPSAPEVNAPRH